MDLNKLQEMAKSIAEQVPEGENKPVGEMDMNHMFQHTTQMVFKMMNEGKLDELGINPETMGQPPQQKKENPEIEEVVSEDESDGEPGTLPKTKNLNYDLNVSLKDIYVGKRKKIHVKRKVYENGKQTTSKKKFVVPIIAGMCDDEIIKFPGEADQKPGHRPGDIVIRLCEEPHPRFERDGNNLLYTMEVSLSEAFHLKTTIEHLDGKLYFLESSDPLHTNNGVRKIDGLGMPIYDETNENDSGERKYGDLYIKFSLKLPERIEDEENKESHVKALRKMFPPLNKVYDKDKSEHVVLEQLSGEEFDTLYQYDYDDDEESEFDSEEGESESEFEGSEGESEFDSEEGNEDLYEDEELDEDEEFDSEPEGESEMDSESNFDSDDAK